jgi:hypothetical protein
MAGFGVIDQDAAHHARGKPEELRAISPVGGPLVDQPEVGLVHEGRRLESMVRALAGQEMPGEAAELLV